MPVLTIILFFYILLSDISGISFHNPSLSPYLSAHSYLRPDVSYLLSSLSLIIRNRSLVPWLITLIAFRLHSGTLLFILIFKPYYSCISQPPEPSPGVLLVIIYSLRRWGIVLQNQYLCYSFPFIPSLRLRDTTSNIILILLPLLLLSFFTPLIHFTCCCCTRPIVP